MSQVLNVIKKLQSGGTPETKPYGVFRMNGRELDGKTAIARLTSIGNGLDLKQREAFSVAKRALEDGHTVSYDADKNLLSVKDKSGNEIFTNYTNTKARYDNSNWKKFWGAQFEDEADQFKRGLRNFALVGMDNPVDQLVKPADNRTKLRKGSGWFDYDTDEEGNKVFRADGMRNQDILAHLDEMQAYFDDIDQSTLKDRYDTSAFGTSRNLEIFRNSYKKLSDEDRANYWSGLIGRIKSNQLRKGDIEALGLFGYTNESDDEDSGGRRTPKLGDLDYIDPKWVGNIDALKRAGLGAYQKDGIWYLTGESNNPYLSSYWHLGGIDLFANTPWANGFIGDNGRLYSDTEFYNANDLSDALSNARHTWFSARDLGSWNERYDRRVASGIRFNGDRTGHDDSYYGAFGSIYNPETHYNREFYNYFAGLGDPRDYNINNLTNQYERLNGRSVIAYIPNSGFNNAGVDNVRYVAYDPSTNQYSTFNNENDLISGLNITGKRFADSNNSLGGSEWTAHKNNDYAKVVEFGNVGRQNTILIDRNGRYWLARKGANGSFLTPANISQNLAREIIANPEKYRDITYQELQKLDNTKKEYIENKQVTSGVYNGYFSPLRKEGGIIPKHQYGGALANSNTTTNFEDTNNIKTDITKAHALDGSDGGLTQNEWLQIGAAIGDLAGLGLTFAGPAGNIAGAAVGAGASTTKFVADIKQDGFQAKDLGNYAMNLALDAATIMPILGTGAKAAKAAKTIKSVAKPLLRFLSISGAAAPVITAVQRIANGEKYTSADLTQAIQGLGSAVIATKNIKDLIGDARLASRVADKKGLAVLNDAKKVVTKSVGDNIKVDATKEQIAELVSNNKTQKSAIDAVKNQFKGVKDGSTLDLDDNQAKKLLTEFGVKFENGKIGFSKDSKWYKAFIGKKEGTVNFDLESARPHSFTRYLLDGRARAKAMQNADQVLTPEYINRVFDRVKFNNGRASLESQALMRASVDRPEWFGNTFRTSSGRSRWFGPYTRYTKSRFISGPFFGGSRYYRPLTVPKASTAAPSQPVLMLPPYNPTPTVHYGFSNQSAPLMLPAPSISFRSFQEAPRLALPPHQPTIFTNIVRGPAKSGKEQFIMGDRVPITFGPNHSFVMFQKKGGKIVKGQGGTYLSKYPITMYDPRQMLYAYDFVGPPIPTGDNKNQTFTGEPFYSSNQHIWDQSRNNNQSSNSNIDLSRYNTVAGDEYLGPPKPIVTSSGGQATPISTTPKITRNANDFGLTPINNNLSDVLAQEQTRALTASNPDGNLVGDAIKELQRKRTGDGGGGLTGNKLGINWANIYDTGRALTAQALANRAFDRYMDNFNDLEKRQFIAPQIDQVRYNDSDIQQGTNNAARPYLENNYIGNDGKNSLAYNLARSQALAQLEASKNAQISDRIIRTNEANRQIDTQSTAARVATANEKSHWLTNIESQKDLARSNKVNTDWANIWGPLTNQFGQQTRDAQNNLRDLDLSYQMSKEQLAAKTRFDNAMSDYRNQFHNLSTEEQNKYGSFDDWMLSDPARAQKYNEEYSLAQTLMRNNLFNAQQNRARWNGQWYTGPLIKFKSGGKTTSKSNRRPYLEDIAINSSKQAQQNVAKMSDHLMRMLQQLMK